MKKLELICLLVMFFAGTLAGQNYTYESVADDPLQTRIYTLGNGLKVYMSVFKDVPRIQTYIAVKVGGKNDPAETTGLAHYFEHLMFKGTDKFGTSDYAREKPLLDEIERLFETYRITRDENLRKALYRQIDSVSQLAAAYAIPNEYDKLMAAIGAKGTNAYTGNDMTVYIEDVPSNQIENWAKIQAERFENNVIRGFHTELETVYEEKNMSLTNDRGKVYEQMMAALFPFHPYGTQTILGSQEHLKNPSITNIKQYFDTWYRPNNMAVALSGDFDPDVMIRTIDRYFGKMQPDRALPVLAAKPETQLSQPAVYEVLGLESPNVMIGWRFPGARSNDSEMLSLIRQILKNSKSGLIDLNLLQQQKVLSASASDDVLADYSMFTLSGSPKEGQSVEEVKELLMEQIAKLKRGEFDAELIQAAVNNQKLQRMRMLERNSSRANLFVESFINGTTWQQEVDKLNNKRLFTKESVVDFAKRHFTDGYVIVYKRQGEDKSGLKIDKPEITPVTMNRDVVSPYLEAIQNSQVVPIEPVFLDFNKDITHLKAKSKVPVLYKRNDLNDLFSLGYVYDMGTNSNKWLGLAFEYLGYLGTDKYTAEQIKSEFFKLAGNFNAYQTGDRFTLQLTGLSENMPKTLALLEHLIGNAQVNQQAYNNLVTDKLKARENSKLRQMEIFGKLIQYAIWGKDSPETNVPSAEELQNKDPQELIDIVRNLKNYMHRMIYYGPMKEKELVKLINRERILARKLQSTPPNRIYTQQPVTENKIYLAPYRSRQVYAAMISNRGETFDNSIEPIRQMYNLYFGGGMNSIVFQELREARGLAYSAGASLNSPSNLRNNYIMQTFIATQNDKLDDALQAFNGIINDIPLSEASFRLAKDGLIAMLRSDRITRENVLWAFIRAQDVGLHYDGRRDLFVQAEEMTMADIKSFQEKWIRDRKYIFAVLGDESDLDMQKISRYGTIERVSLKDLFGY